MPRVRTKGTLKTRMVKSSTKIGKVTMFKAQKEKEKALLKVFYYR
jgi:transcription initiation factor TFIID subunit TAF12